MTCLTMSACCSGHWGRHFKQQKRMLYLQCRKAPFPPPINGGNAVLSACTSTVVLIDILHQKVPL